MKKLNTLFSSIVYFHVQIKRYDCAGINLNILSIKASNWNNHKPKAVFSITNSQCVSRGFTVTLPVNQKEAGRNSPERSQKLLEGECDF